MGFSGIARWFAPTEGVTTIYKNLTNEHGGRHVGDWNLTMKSFRSDLGSVLGNKIAAERNMCTLTMNGNVFVSLEDPAAQQRSPMSQQPGDPPLPPGTHSNTVQTHHRSTFLTVSPPEAMESMLNQLRARWARTRQTSRKGPLDTGPQVIITGKVFALGTDWIVRVGAVSLAGQVHKGVILEAEYLPLPALHVTSEDGTTELVSNLLLSIIPSTYSDARTEAVSMSDAQWEDVLYEDDVSTAPIGSDDVEDEDEDDIFVPMDDKVGKIQKNDWIGVDRDRRSAFLIIGVMKAEGLL